MKRNSSLSFGVVIVAYRSEDVIVPCLESLLNCGYPGLKIVVCNNASPDNTAGVIRDWAQKRAAGPDGPERPVTHRNPDRATFSYGEMGVHGDEPDSIAELPFVTLMHTGQNRGYAGGVNMGLKLLRAHDEISAYWILNPDCVVAKGTADAFAEAALQNPDFGLMGGRIQYFGEDEQIQSDGGRVHLWTGMCANIGLGKSARETAAPKSSDIAFVNGACVIASRLFLDRVGLMKEEYFLYYEEVDWAFRRGALPIVYAQGAVVYHHVGTSIGSATLKRSPSAFANYFNYRNRIYFMRRFYPLRLPVVYGYSLLKIVALTAKGSKNEALAAIAGLFDLAPPRAILTRL